MCFCLCIEVAEDRQTEIKLPNISDVFTVDERLRQEREGQPPEHYFCRGMVGGHSRAQTGSRRYSTCLPAHHRGSVFFFFAFERLEVQISHVGTN